MLQIPGATGFIGCIGKDKFGEEMKKSSNLAGVNVSFFYFVSVNYSPIIFLNAISTFILTYLSVLLIIRFTIVRMRLHLLELVLSVFWVVKGWFDTKLPLRFSFYIICYCSSYKGKINSLAVVVF